MALIDDFELPDPKRQRLEQTTTVSRPTGSRLFAPFRTIGLVSPTPVPFTSVPLGTTTFQVTTSVGRSIQTYDLRRGLNLVFLSRPQCPETITATHAYRDRIFVAWGGTKTGSSHGVWVLKRGRVIGVLESDTTVEQDITHLLVFGAWIIGVGSRAIEVWRNNSYEHYTTILAPVTDHSFAFSGGICSIPTFLNKIMVGSLAGYVYIYNVSTGKLVHTLQPYASGSGHVTALAPAPAIGLVAVAYSNGALSIIDVQTDDVVIQLQNTVFSNPISSISFRTDGTGAGEDGTQDGIMATSSQFSGDITFWDLNRGGKVVGILRSAHETMFSVPASGVNKVEFLPGQPVLISSGLDNALRTWIFDQTPFSSTPRPLHSRKGHAAPISTLRFLPAASDGSEAAGKWLLSAGQDRSLWGFSLRKDGQSGELSQGNVKAKAKRAGGFSDSGSGVEDLKVSPIVSIACSLNRDGGMGSIGGPVWTNPKSGNAEEANMTGWESIVTAHESDRFARTWFWGRKKAGRWTLETGDHQPASCVAITMCGTFALVGSVGGSLDMYNLQSGIHRQRFPPRLKPSQAKQLKLQQIKDPESPQIQQGHSDRVTGIVVDNLNKTAVSSSLDGTIIYWDFVSGNIIHKAILDSGLPSAMNYNSVSGLVSVACDDACIRVIDIDTRRTVRELWGCVGQIYDHCFSHDGRWIVASSMDSVIRVFDLATGHLIDAFRTITCTNVAFSSTGEFLATTHAGSIGINVWNNKSLFTHVSTQQISEEAGVVDLTGDTAFEAATQLATQDLVLQDADDIDPLGDQTSVEQLDTALLTLSLTPSSKWQTLLNLDTIRERNKPVQPPQKPKAAPFFLGSTLANGRTGPGPDSESAIDSREVVASVSAEEVSKISRLSSLAPDSTPMSNLLLDFTNDSVGDPSPIIAHLTSLTPSAADLEIRSLTLREMAPFVNVLRLRLAQRRDFELVNTWMNVFLRLHAEFISEVDEINEAVSAFKEVMSLEEERLSALVGWGRGVVDFLRSSR